MRADGSFWHNEFCVMSNTTKIIITTTTTNSILSYSERVSFVSC
jgi:hypothetical protein